jgi:hypothetical protein
MLDTVFQCIQKYTAGKRFSSAKGGIKVRRRSQTHENHARAQDQERFSQPTAREAAMLVIRLIHARQKETSRQVTRARLSELSLRRLWVRSQIPSSFLRRVQEILIQAGWALFWAGSSYAIIKTDAVEGWTLISSKRMSDDLEKISRNLYDFNQLEKLLLPKEEAVEDEDDFEDSPPEE